MRVSEDRYARDLRSLNLAHRMIGHEVRTRWIRAWTGLSANRIRNLFRSYDKDLHRVIRHRGPSPTQLAAFVQSPALRAEASAVGGLACALGAIPASNTPHSRRDGAQLEAHERLVDVFDLFHQLAPQSQFRMDQFIPLVTALAAGEELQLSHCTNCHSALLIDPLGTDRRLCLACEEDSLKKGRRPRRTPPGSAGAAPGPPEAVEQETHGQEPPYQLPLFEHPSPAGPVSVAPV